jgi:hypothetical protein
MPRSPSRAFDTCLYRTALWLCPSAFRRAYADEMVRDFAEAHDEASTGRAGGLWSLRLVMAVDVVRTVLVQWARTGLPLIAVISLTLALVLAEGVATLARRAAFEIPADTMHAEMIGVVLLATTAVFIIAMTIVLTLWAAGPTRRGRRRG